jgi:N4-gp56 family major capsid protein
MSASQQAISVYEWANAIGVSEKLVRLAHLDGLKEAALLLGRDYAVTNDLMCRDCIAGASQVQYAGGRASRAALVGGTDYFDVEVIRLGVEILQTANAPKFNSDFYVCFVHPHQTAYLKRDPDWVSANNYANTRALFTGELGRWEDVVFIGTTHAQNGAANTSNPGYLAALKDAATGGSANASVYEALLFADSSFGVATALPVEMRDDGVRNFGRKHGIAWYSIEGAGILEDGFIVRIETV